MKARPAILFFLCLATFPGAWSQNVPDELKQIFLYYTHAVPREEIFVHSDRDTYIAGEVAWFTVYMLDRQSFHASGDSKIAYFELLNPENRPVLQKRILLNRGFGPGEMTLPDTLRSGTYTIRAYTGWMKNFLPENCFTKDIRIFNALRPAPFLEKRQKADTLRSGIEKDLLQQARGTGVTFTVDNTGPGDLRLLVKSDSLFRAENPDTCYVFIQTHGNINYISTEKVTSDPAIIAVPISVLTPGINQVTLFNSGGVPVAERYIYTPGKGKQSPLIHMADSYGRRSKITLEANAVKPAAGSTQPGNLSISVAPVSDSGDIMDLDDYMVWGSEFGITPRNGNGSRKELTPAGIDSLLLHVKSNWINWKTILSHDLPQYRYEQEKEAHFLFGGLYAGQQPVDTGERVILCAPGKEARFQYTITDPKGNFSFRIPINEGQTDLIMMPADSTEKYKIIPKSSFADVYSSPVQVDSAREAVPPYISKWSVNYQVSRLYGITSLGRPLDSILPPAKPKRFYGKPDFELIMADYISLPVMQEVFFEILPHVALKKKNSGFEIIITDRVDNQPYMTIPCIMIDGVIINDAALIIDLDPEMVEKIDVIREKYIVGGYSFSGIVNVITKTGDFSCVPLPDYMVRLPYRVTGPVSSFVSPDYSSPELKKSRLADYRNTLYWNPSVSRDETGRSNIEFWSSDNAGDYVVNIQGILPDGSFCSFQKLIRVR